MAMAKKTGRSKGEGRFSRFRKKRTNHFREMWLELKKVHWPTRHQLLIYTGVVLVSVGIIAFLIWIVDSGLAYLMNVLIGG
ncbi:MAG: preprotein translocase subunit SecE [Desulfitobacteriia bacterium]|jgi:preprotein translocase subunit SecE